MKALVLNGERKNEAVLSAVEEIVMQELSSICRRADTVLLRDKKIAPCMGCFDCWIKTPGVCAINDFGREVARMVIESDLTIFLTPIEFGGYSFELKKAVDRFACTMLLPFFTKINGEVHHKPRYNPLPDLIGIGVLPNQDAESERIFRDLVSRNATNLHSRLSQSAILYESQNPESLAKEVHSLLTKIRERS